jgi:hypothetical protein
MSLARPAATIAVVALLLAGCGGSSSAQRPFAPTANAICAKTSEALRKVPAIGGTHLVLDVSEQLPIYQQQLDQLTALKAPAGKASAYAKALKGARTDVGLLHQLYSAAKARNSKQVHAIAVQGSSVYSAAAAEMRGIGLTRCATSL